MAVRRLCGRIRFRDSPVGVAQPLYCMHDPVDWVARRVAEVEGVVWGLDAYASATTAVAARYLGPLHPEERYRDPLRCERWASLAADGPIWVAPPYTRALRSWLHRVVAESVFRPTYCRLPARIETAWFHDTVLRHGRIIYVVRGRLPDTTHPVAVVLLDGVRPPGARPFMISLEELDGR